MATFKFKFEGIDTFVQLFQKEDFFINFDLKNAYHSFAVNVLHQSFLGFSWNSKFYKFRCLPFGLSVSGYCFTKCLKAPVKYWRGHKNFKCFLFLDDGYAGHSDLRTDRKSVV
jgi:hypothetical protein